MNHNTHSSNLNRAVKTGALLGLAALTMTGSTHESTQFPVHNKPPVIALLPEHTSPDTTDHIALQTPVTVSIPAIHIPAETSTTYTEVVPTTVSETPTTSTSLPESVLNTAPATTLPKATPHTTTPTANTASTTVATSEITDPTLDLSNDMITLPVQPASEVTNPTLDLTNDMITLPDPSDTTANVAVGTPPTVEN